MSTTKKKKYGLVFINPQGKLYQPRPGIVGETEQFLDTARQFEKDHSDEKKVRVRGWTTLWWGGRVSTVWLGLDMGMLRIFNKNAKALIFESMVFSPFGDGDIDCRRYSTRRQAIAGHKRMVAEWSTFGKGIEGLTDSFKNKWYAMRHWEMERIWNRFRLEVNHLNMGWIKGQKLLIRKIKELIK